MFAMFAAFYRALRPKNVETWVLAITTILTALGNAPIGNALWSGFPTVKTWIMDVPVAASQRSLTVLTAIGLAGIAVRTILGQNRIWMGIIELATAKAAEEE
jgi:hypothetical protein